MKRAQPMNNRLKSLATMPLLALLAIQTGCATNSGSSTSTSTQAKQLSGQGSTSTSTTDYVPKTTNSTSTNTSYGNTASTSSTATANSTSAADTKTSVPATTTTAKQPNPTPAKATPVKQKPVEKAKTVEKSKPVTKTQAVEKKPTAAKAAKSTSQAAVKTSPAAKTKPVKVEKKTAREEVQIALAEPVPQNPALPSAEEMAAETSSMPAITAADLPYSFGVWTLERNWDNQHPDTCRLITSKLSLSDGYEDTTLRAEVLLDAINIYTGSHIDLTYENSGIQIGDTALLPYSQLKGETNATVEGEYISQLASAGEMTVNMGFWPTWPKTETQQVVIPLQDMNRALAALLACKNL